MVRAVAADIISTEHWLDRPNTYEKNRLLGKHPSDSELLAFGVGLVAVHTVLGNQFEWYRNYIWPLQCGVSGYHAQRNYRKLTK